MSRPKSRDLDTVFEPCTCGRKRYDFTDLAVIYEEDGVFFPGRRGAAMKSPKSKVVCLRPGCKGAKKSSKLFVQKLPRIMNWEYLAIKREQNEKLKEESSGISGMDGSS